MTNNQVKEDAVNYYVSMIRHVLEHPLYKQPSCTQLLHSMLLEQMRKIEMQTRVNWQ